MSEPTENITQIEIDYQMEEKKRKLHSRPESEELDNILNSKRRKLNNNKHIEQATDQHSTHETEEEVINSEDAYKQNPSTEENKQTSTPLKSARPKISKSRSNLKSKSRSKSRSKIIFKDSAKISASKSKVQTLTESSYCLRPRKNIDYSKLAVDDSFKSEKLISCTGNPADSSDKSDDSDMSFKAESFKKISECSKDSVKNPSHSKEATSNEAYIENNEDRSLNAYSNGAPITKKKSETICEEDKSNQANVESKKEIPNNIDDVQVEDGEDSGNEYDSLNVNKDEILHEMKELQGKSIIMNKIIRRRHSKRKREL